MLTIKIHLGPDTFEFSGAVPLPELLPVLATWYARRQQPELDRAQLREMTAHLTESTTALADAVRANAAP